MGNQCHLGVKKDKNRYIFFRFFLNNSGRNLPMYGKMVYYIVI